MSILSHTGGSRVVTGKLRQIRYVLSGKAVVVRKGPAGSEDATAYLLSNDSNRSHLDRGLAEFERGEARARPLQ